MIKKMLFIFQIELQLCMKEIFYKLETAKEIYHHPNDLYCANFLGKMTEISKNSYIRPEHIEICEDGEFEATIKVYYFYGSFMK